MKNINFGFIGCGWIIEKTYLPILQQMNDVVLSSVYDLDEKKAQRCALEFGIERVCNSVDSLLDTLIDVVIIATPNYTHELYIRKAIEKNKHVICEKPTVFQVATYDQLQEEAKKREHLFLPAYVNEFRSDVIELHKLVASGVIGNVRTVECGWIRKCGYPGLGSWFTNKDYSGGGVLMDLGPHVLEISLRLLNTMNQPVQTLLETWYDTSDSVKNQQCSAQWYNTDKQSQYEINVETSAVGKVLYPQEKSLIVKLSWNASVDHDETYYVVTGEKGKITLRTLFGFSTNRIDDFNKIHILLNDGKKTKMVFADVMSEQMNSFKRLCEYYIHCIRIEEIPETIIRNGRNVVELTELLYQNEKVKQGNMGDYLSE